MALEQKTLSLVFGKQGGEEGSPIERVQKGYSNNFVGAGGFEPPTPALSRQCSTTELRAYVNLPLQPVLEQGAAISLSFGGCQVGSMADVDLRRGSSRTQMRLSVLSGRSAQTLSCCS